MVRLKQRKYYLLVALVALTLFLMLGSPVNAAPAYSQTTISIAVGTDDAYEAADGSPFNNISTVLQLRDEVTNPNNVRNSALRFINIPFDQGDVIDEAYITLQTVSCSIQGPDLIFTGEIYAEDVDSGTVPAQGFTNWTRTSAVEPFDVDMVICPSVVQTVNVASVINEILARPGWVNSNAITLIIIADMGLGPLLYNFKSYDDSPAVAAELTLIVGPAQTTDAVTGITGTTATGNATTTDLSGGGNLDERGFVYGRTSKDPEGGLAPGESGYDHYVSESGSFGLESYSSAINTLVPNTTYYIRAFGHNDTYTYGNEVTFRTEAPTLFQSLINLIIIAVAVLIVAALLIWLRVLSMRPESLLVVAVIGMAIVVVVLLFGNELIMSSGF